MSSSIVTVLVLSLVAGCLSQDNNFQLIGQTAVDIINSEGLLNLTVNRYLSKLSATIGDSNNGSVFYQNGHLASKIDFVLTDSSAVDEGETTIFVYKLALADFELRFPKFFLQIGSTEVTGQLILTAEVKDSKIELIQKKTPDGCIKTIDHYKAGDPKWKTAQSFGGQMNIQLVSGFGLTGPYGSMLYTADPKGKWINDYGLHTAVYVTDRSLTKGIEQAIVVGFQRAIAAYYNTCFTQPPKPSVLLRKILSPRM